ncbi:MAG: hypothetical protein JNL83_04080 [Myxococcales bacterium]|nr:hypothetical protein [Myxococcales bacterium]
MRARLAWLTLLVACGRVGFDPVGPPADGPDPIVDVARDAPAVCPGGTVAITAGARVCIEELEHGFDTWTAAVTMCGDAGMRLCTGAEWVAACENATGLVDLLGDNWEWVADMVDSGIAEKRGGSTVCTDISSHVITDPYEVRCCKDL